MLDVELRVLERFGTISIDGTKIKANASKHKAVSYERVRGKPKPGKSEPDPKAQYNFTDPESRIMKAGNGKHFEQSYNAQAAVDVNSRLLIATDVTDEPNDKKQLAPVIESVGIDYTPQTVLVDSGYFSAEAVDNTEQNEHGDPTGITVLAATGRKSHHRTVEDIEKSAASPAKIKTNTANGMSKQVMSERLSRPENRKLYAQRKQTIEPVFGILGLE